MMSKVPLVEIILTLLNLQLRRIKLNFGIKGRIINNIFTPMFSSEIFAVLAFTFRFIVIYLGLLIPFYINLLIFASILFSILFLSISANN